MKTTGPVTGEHALFCLKGYIYNVKRVGRSKHKMEMVAHKRVVMTSVKNRKSYEKRPFKSDDKSRQRHSCYGGGPKMWLHNFNNHRKANRNCHRGLTQQMPLGIPPCAVPRCPGLYPVIHKASAGSPSTDGETGPGVRGSPSNRGSCCR